MRSGKSMSRRRKSIVAIAVSGLAFSGIALGVAFPDDETIILVSSRNVAYAGQAASYSFGISAQQIPRLYPGVMRMTTLSITNPYHFSMQVTQLQAEVVSSSRRACKPTRNNVIVGRYTGRLPLTVPRFGTRAIEAIPVSMPRNASPECARTTFTIRLVGAATRAR
jgi:hypothetical protein